MNWSEFLIPAIVLLSGLPCVSIALVYSRTSTSATKQRIFAFFLASTGVSFIMAIGIFLRTVGILEGMFAYYVVWSITFCLLAIASYNALGVAFFLVGRNWTVLGRIVFGVLTLIAYGMTFAISAEGGSDPFFPYIQGTFSFTSLFLFASLAFALWVVIRNRKRLSEQDRETLERFILVFLPLGTLLLLDELLRVTHWIDIPSLPLLPLSPLSLYLFSAVEMLRRIWNEHNGEKETVSSVNELVESIMAACQSSPLTNREREVLTGMFEGLSNSSIASRFHLSPHTVKNHISNIYQKTGAGGRKELYYFALRDKRMKETLGSVFQDNGKT